MHIKKVIIQGFGSYSKAENPELFEPGINAILGVNGSGKSNFFKAIQFVLSSKYSKIDEEHMKELFYKGRHDAVSTARVDIVFDNSDERFPVEADEVVIRRTISGTNDSFYVNNKLYTKPEMESFLETAGFSRDNPYYMVEQGSVKQICELSDEGRLKLLKEVAGTRSYEERRKESEAILDDTNLKVTQVHDLIEDMNNSLKELETEKEDLEEYEKFDRERRICVYFLASADIREKEEEVNRCNTNRTVLADNLSSLHSQYDQAKDEVQQVSEEMEALKNEQSSIENTLTEIESERKTLLQDVTSMELDLTEMQGSLARNKQKQKKAAEEKERLDGELQRNLTELQQIMPALQESLDSLSSTDSALSTLQSQLQLQRKHQKYSRFSSQSERVSFIQQELRPLQEDKAKKGEMVSSLQQELAGIQQEEERLNNALVSQAERKKQMKEQQDGMKQQLTEVRQSLEAVLNERKRLWKENETKNTELENERVNLDKDMSELSRVLPHDTKVLVDSLSTLPIPHVSSIYGPLINLFKPKQERFITALDNVAGARLFNIVVQNDQTATEVIEYCKQQQSGRVTLLPIDQMKDYVKEIEYPNDSRCFPLIRCVDFSDEVKPIVQHVFGGTLLCEDLQTAAEVAEEYHMDCITLAGEKVGKRGVLHGGYFNAKLNRLRLWKNVCERQEKAKSIEDEKNQNQNKLESIHKQELDLLTQEAQSNSAMRILASSLASTLAEERETVDQLQRYAERREQVLSSLSAAEREFQAIGTEIAELENEMNNPSSMLSQERLTELEQQLLQTEQQRASQSQAAESLRLRRVQIESQNILIRKQLIDITETLAENAPTETAVHSVSSQTVVNSQQMKLQQKQEELERVQNDYAQLQQRKTAINRKQEELQRQKEDLQKKEEELESKIAMLRNRMQELLQKRNNALGLLEEKRRDVSVISSIPAGAERYREYSQSRLKSLLNKANQHLMKFDKINRKAMNQFLLFSERKEEFQKRHEELEEGIQSIRELISTLDERKNEAILRTFKQVARHFTESFEQMVPGGHAELVVKKESPESEEYSGIGIKVAFENGEVKKMNQLSGGQKAVVAIALIFAIQRADPAPFYLLDEVDAELDVQYRTMVAKLVRSQADEQGDKCQIFCTTFKPEILEVANNFYRVTVKNEASRIDKMDKEQAIEFVEARQNENQTNPYHVY